MTYEDGLILLNKYGFLGRIPSEFHTKEFVIWCVDSDDDTVFPYNELTMCGIKIDYDIILAFELREIRVHKTNPNINQLKIIYNARLTDEELDKLATTLTLIYWN